LLGDWSFKFVEVPQGRFCVAVNAPTLMAVAFRERPLAWLPNTLAACMGAQLETMGISQAKVASEMAAFESVAFGKNRNRSLTGIVNEVAYQFEADTTRYNPARPSDLLEIHTRLNGMPHRASSRSYVIPHDSVATLLGTGTGEK
jgi:hypothetical protein